MLIKIILKLKREPEFHQLPPTGVKQKQMKSDPTVMKVIDLF